MKKYRGSWAETLTKRSVVGELNNKEKVRNDDEDDNNNKNKNAIVVVVVIILYHITTITTIHSFRCTHYFCLLPTTT